MKEFVEKSKAQLSGAVAGVLLAGALVSGKDTSQLCKFPPKGQATSIHSFSGKGVKQVK